MQKIQHQLVAFGAVFRALFEVTIDRQHVLLVKGIQEARANGPNLFLATADIMSIHLGVRELLEPVTVEPQRKLLVNRILQGQVGVQRLPCLRIGNIAEPGLRVIILAVPQIHETSAGRPFRREPVSRGVVRVERPEIAPGVDRAIAIVGTDRNRNVRLDTLGQQRTAIGTGDRRQLQKRADDQIAETGARTQGGVAQTVIHVDMRQRRVDCGNTRHGPIGHWLTDVDDLRSHRQYIHVLFGKLQFVAIHVIEAIGLGIVQILLQIPARPRRRRGSVVETGVAQVEAGQVIGVCSR